MSQIPNPDLSLLSSRFETLQHLNQQLSQAIKADTEQALFLPNASSSHTEQRQLAAQALSQLWYTNTGENIQKSSSQTEQSTETQAGIICTSQAICDLAADLNHAKLEFKAAIASLRQQSKGSASRALGALLEPFIDAKNKRDAQTAAALSQAGIARLDLLKCYRQIRILPPSLESISWTWARSHSKIERLTLKQAKQVAANRVSGELLQEVHAKLDTLKPDAHIARMFALPDQLRANITWYENALRKRKAITISGIVLAPKSDLPKIVWRDKKPEKGDRLMRFDTNIDRQAFIPELNFYLYRSKGEA